MKDLKETLDALSRYGREWWFKLWLPYGVLAVVTGAFVALLLRSCASTFFPLIEWWRATGDWTLAMEMTDAAGLWTSLAGICFVALFPASWMAHRAMVRVVRNYENRDLRGRRRALGVLTAGAIMMVTLLVMWMPVATLFLSAHATALSEVWGDAVVPPAWVCASAFVAAAAAMFLAEWAMTLCRLMFKNLPAREIETGLSQQ